MESYCAPAPPAYGGGRPHWLVVGAEWRATRESLAGEGFTTWRLSDYCPHPDKIPNFERLWRALRQELAENPRAQILVVGCGEWAALRGYREGLQELLERQERLSLEPQQQLIFLWRGRQRFLEEAAQRDPRFKPYLHILEEWNPQLELEIVRWQDLGWAPSSNCYQGLKNLLYALEEWRPGDSRRLDYQSAIPWSQASLKIRSLDSAWAVFKERLGPLMRWEEGWGSPERWEKLLERHREVEIDALSKGLEAELRPSGLSLPERLARVASSLGGEAKIQERWQLWLGLKEEYGLNPQPQRYLERVMRASQTPEDLGERLWSTLWEESAPKQASAREELFWERYELLKRSPLDQLTPDWAQTWLPQLRRQQDYQNYLSDLTPIERIEWLRYLAQKGSLGVSERQLVEKHYPDLGRYLNGAAPFYKLPLEDRSLDFMDSYFQTYREAKVLNSIPADFLEIVRQQAIERLYNRLSTKEGPIAKYDQPGSCLYWVDALGVEYLPYLVALCREFNLKCQVSILRANLPTLTSTNKDFFEEWQGPKVKESELDKLKHGNADYDFSKESRAATHLPAELSLLRRVVQDCARRLESGQCQRLLLASDHGASRLAVLYGREASYEMAQKGRHSGRCCPCSEWEDCNLENVSRENGYWVLADYERFKGGRAASVEVHGGASLEEVVIPLLVLSSKASLPPERLPAIELLTPSAEYSRKKGITLHLQVPWTNAPDLELRWNDEVLPLQEEKPSIYRAYWEKPPGPAAYTLELYRGGVLQKELQIQVSKKKGMTQNSEFDF